MKTERYQKRFYRDAVAAKDLVLTRVVAKETDLQILTNKAIDKGFVEERIRSYRYDIENYIGKDHRFLSALKPIEVELTAPPIIRKMAEAAKKANVGPMTAVAGAIAQFLGEDLLKRGFKDVIIENGGDIFLKTRKTSFVGIYAGRSRLWNKLKLKIKPSETPLALCTSSGTIGHSLSFGQADCVVIVAKNACLADSVATATGNLVRTKQDMQPALAYAKAVRGVQGAVIIVKDSLVSWGKIEFTS